MERNKKAKAKFTVKNYKALLSACRIARRKWGRLHDIVSDIVEGGRLKESDIPDDYMALTLALEDGGLAEIATLNAINQAEKEIK